MMAMVIMYIAIGEQAGQDAGLEEACRCPAGYDQAVEPPARSRAAAWRRAFPPAAITPVEKLCG